MTTKIAVIIIIYKNIFSDENTIHMLNITNVMCLKCSYSVVNSMIYGCLRSVHSNIMTMSLDDHTT